MRRIVPILVLALSASFPTFTGAKGIVHDAEYYIFESQNGER